MEIIFLIFFYKIVPCLQPVQAGEDDAAAVADLLLRNGQGRGDAEGGVAKEEPVAHYARLLEQLHDAVQLG